MAGQTPTTLEGKGMRLADFAPETADFYQRDPDTAFARLRADDPVHWYEDGQFWCITRHEDIRAVSRAPRLFSSARGLLMFQIPVAREGMELHTAGIESANTILEMDPPEHIRHRRLVTSAFKPSYVQHLQTRIREIARSTLDACDPTGEVDFVEQVAVPLPMLVIAEMIGVPGDDVAMFRQWSDSIIEVGGGGGDEQSAEHLAELWAYLGVRVEEHRSSPRDDIITLLLDAEIDGERLSEDDLLMFLMTLLVAGNETTRNLIAGGARALAEHPDQRVWLAEDLSRIPVAVEEMLRWVSPVRSFVRCATADTTVGGTAISEGDYLVLFYGSANRDEVVFGDSADRFDASRADANRHLAFGIGEHHCLGAALARMEAQVMFEELLERFPTWERAGEVEPLESCLMNGLTRMPVRLQTSR
ncbi:MAG: cytochrome P450 [Actinomycetia bacterium]|nr:cytochrome P450 [Actinomycetes bacterium]